MVHYRIGILLFLAALFCGAIILTGSGIAPGGDMFPSRVRPESRELRSSFERSGLMAISTELPSEGYRRLLGADEILYLRIVGGVEFELYVARWSAGNPFAFEALNHPPDVCWSRTGWVCERMRSAVEVHPGIAVAEWRLFSGANLSQEVAFWTIFDGRVMPLGYTRPDQLPRPRKGWDIVSESAFLKAWRQSAEAGTFNFHETTAATVPTAIRGSYFVRVNSARKLEGVFQSQEFARLKGFFREIGLSNSN